MKIMRPTGFHGNTSPAAAAGGHTAGGSPSLSSLTVATPFDAAGAAAGATGTAGTAAGTTAGGRRRPGSAHAGRTQAGRNRRRSGRGIRTGVSLVTSAARTMSDGRLSIDKRDDSPNDVTRRDAAPARGGVNQIYVGVLPD